MPDRKLNGRVAVITGASSGFGKGTALAFAHAGASVVLAARREQLLEDLARECEAAGVQALAIPTDVGIQQDMEHLAQAAVSRFNRIDVWVNNAGVGAIGRFLEVPLSDHLKVIETDLIGTLYGSYCALRQFRIQNSGTLINISSALGKHPAPYYASYTAAKHGVVGLSASIRQELNREGMTGIHICTVMPVSFDTPFFDHAANYTGRQIQPIPPLYEPQRVIDTIVQLATDPEDEVIVGTSGKVLDIAHHVIPGLIEAVMGKQTQKTQFEKAPPAAETGGAVQEPTAVGAEVRGGRLRK